MKARTPAELRLDICEYLSIAGKAAMVLGDSGLSAGLFRMAHNLKVEAEQETTGQPPPPKRTA